jgi:hypothetical protein
VTPQSQKPPASQTLLAIRDLLDDSGAPGCDLMRAFVEHRDEIDVETATYLMRCLIGVVAVETGETPRTILEREFGLAPSDQFWRGDLTPAPRKLPAAQ